MNLKKDYDISYAKVHQVMKENGLVVPSAAKSRRRKWIRYERKHSNSMMGNDNLWNCWRISCRLCKLPEKLGSASVECLIDEKGS